MYLPPGGPGSGRAEQCEMMVDRYPGSVHVSMGVLLREQVSRLASSDAKWNTIKRLMNEGNMVPEVGSTKIIDICNVPQLFRFILLIDDTIILCSDADVHNLPSIINHELHSLYTQQFETIHIPRLK